MERIDPHNQRLFADVGWEHIQRYAFAGAFVDGKAVLDCGCGAGYGSWCLAQYGAASVTGIDIAEGVVASAAERYAHERIKFRAGDSTAIPFEDGSFDVVVCLENVEHLDEPARFFAEASRVLEAGGRAVVSVPNRLQFSEGPFKTDNEFHKSEPTWDELVAWLSPYFSIARQFEQTRADACESEVRNTVAELALSPLRRIEGIFRKQNQRQKVRLPRVWPYAIDRNFEIIPLLPERTPFALQFLVVLEKKV